MNIQNICEIRRLTKNAELVNDVIKESTDEDGRFFLFLSFDLVGSTAFKAQYPMIWSTVFTTFYLDAITNLQLDNTGPSENDGITSSMSNRKLWKFIGDEILIYVEINKFEELYEQVVDANKTLQTLMQTIACDVEKKISYDNKCCEFHRRDVKNIILSELGIKATAWIAECYMVGNKKNTDNIIYIPENAPSDFQLDFLGKDVDEGFRISKYAVKNKLILSPLLAWMIWESSTEDRDRRKIVESNFRITSFAEMKGVWKGRKVPIVMYSQKFDEFKEELEYDDLDLETYSNIKNVGLKEFLVNEDFNIKSINSILKHIYKYDYAKNLYRKIKEKESNQEKIGNRIVSGCLANKQEFHIACLIMDERKNILVHKHTKRGFEFGCIKKDFNTGNQSWKQICEDGYKDKYNIAIEVDENPIPVATYFYEEKNALGLIVMAKYNGDKELSNAKGKWEFKDTKQLLKELSENKCKTVDNFKENIENAIKLRKGK